MVSIWLWSIRTYTIQYTFMKFVHGLQEYSHPSIHFHHTSFQKEVYFWLSKTILLLYNNRGSTVFHSVSLLVFYMRISNEEIIMVGRLLPCLIIFQIRLVVVVYPGCCKGNQFTFGKCILHIVYSRKNSSVVVFLLIFFKNQKHPSCSWIHFDEFFSFLNWFLIDVKRIYFCRTQNVGTLKGTSDSITL